MQGVSLNIRGSRICSVGFPEDDNPLLGKSVSKRVDAVISAPDLPSDLDGIGVVPPGLRDSKLSNAGRIKEGNWVGREASGITKIPPTLHRSNVVFTATVWSEGVMHLGDNSGILGCNDPRKPVDSGRGVMQVIYKYHSG